MIRPATVARPRARRAARRGADAELAIAVGEVHLDVLVVTNSRWAISRVRQPAAASSRTRSSLGVSSARPPPSAAARARRSRPARGGRASASGAAPQPRRARARGGARAALTPVVGAAQGRAEVHVRPRLPQPRRRRAEDVGCLAQQLDIGPEEARDPQRAADRPLGAPGGGGGERLVGHRVGRRRRPARGARRELEPDVEPDDAAASVAPQTGSASSRSARAAGSTPPAARIRPRALRARCRDGREAAARRGRAPRAEPRLPAPCPGRRALRSAASAAGRGTRRRSRPTRARRARRPRRRARRRRRCASSPAATTPGEGERRAAVDRLLQGVAERGFDAPYTPLAGSHSTVVMSQIEWAPGRERSRRRAARSTSAATSPRCRRRSSPCARARKQRALARRVARQVAEASAAASKRAASPASRSPPGSAPEVSASSRSCGSAARAASS